MKKYSVLLLYPDYMADDWPFDTYYAFVKAKNVSDAVNFAQHSAVRANGGYEEFESVTDFWPILCIEGHHKICPGTNAYFPQNTGPGILGKRLTAKGC